MTVVRIMDVRVDLNMNSDKYNQFNVIYTRRNWREPMTLSRLIIIDKTCWWNNHDDLTTKFTIHNMLRNGSNNDKWLDLSPFEFVLLSKYVHKRTRTKNGSVFDENNLNKAGCVQGYTSNDLWPVINWQFNCVGRINAAITTFQPLQNVIPIRHLNYIQIALNAT